jgi:hypothetical protein
MGVLVRCENCGEVRWSVLAAAGSIEAALCEGCGRPLAIERRRPGTRFAEQAKEERRDFRPLAPPPA